MIFTRPAWDCIWSQAGLVTGELVLGVIIRMRRGSFTRCGSARGWKQRCVFTFWKSESAEEALWWRARSVPDAGEANARPAAQLHQVHGAGGITSDGVSLVMEEFAYHLREHIIGLNLGRWDYMASSLIHFNLDDLD